MIPRRRLLAAGLMGLAPLPLRLFANAGPEPLFRDLERPRLHRDRLVSVFSLMRDKKNQRLGMEARVGIEPTHGVENA